MGVPMYLKENNATWNGATFVVAISLRVPIGSLILLTLSFRPVYKRKKIRDQDSWFVIRLVYCSQRSRARASR